MGFEVDFEVDDVYYQAAQQFDKAGNMHFVLGFTYEIDSCMNIDEKLAQAAEVQKFNSAQVKANWIKLFMDGTVESGTSFIDHVYPDGHQGIINWTEEELTDITRKANAKGLTMPKDMLTCPVTEIHTAQPEATYFVRQKGFL